MGKATGEWQGLCLGEEYGEIPRTRVAGNLVGEA